MNLLRRIFSFWPKASPAVPTLPPIPGVSFSSIWLGGSKGIQRLEEQESSSLDADRLHRVAAALTELKGGSWKSTPIDGIQFSLGIPPYFESQLDSFPLDAIRKSPRFFSCYGEDATKPFWMSALLVGDETLSPVEASPAEFREVNDAYLLSELFGLAGWDIPSEARLREKTFATIIQHRPCVVFFQAAEGTGEMLDNSALPRDWDRQLYEVLRKGFDGAVAIAAVQLHQEQGIPLPSRRP